MAQQAEPLYDFPEPAKPCQRKLLCPQRGRGSLRSISVLDRLLLTVPVWLQLSINPATALHILQREPPGTFLVRQSRTSKRKVLCVRLADDSVPSFVQQFGIREEQSTLSLETSAISFPDLPRLTSFYCVSRDVLPFPLELPEAIAKAASHKELESISHMGIEFWSSHLNVRGPRDAPKPKKAEEKKPDVAASVSPPPLPDSPPHLDSNNDPPAAPEPDAHNKTPDPNPTLFHEFCPITTRSPSELDCGAGQGALCFVNPLFLQSQNALCRRRMFKRSLKVRVSTETLTQLSPPLAPPPPPPLLPKTKGRCKAQRRGEGAPADASRTQNPSGTPHFLFEMKEEEHEDSDTDQSKAGVKEVSAQFPAIKEHLLDEYMTPPVNHPTSLSPYHSPSVSPIAPPLFPKSSPVLPSLDSLSPYQSPSISPKAPSSPNRSPSISPSLSSPHTELVCSTPEREEEEEEEELPERNQDDDEDLNKEESMELQMSAASLEDVESCSLNGNVEEAAETSEQTAEASSEQT
ncbi:wiskott-Aldrich syndrome protein homolog 1 [Austrofundulus limnaeus]|uniref:Wiskott-Aldrich syndrome protein homolog 1 n=1 Tax=Austrofundulus limnaeus TaxID=52670 RepID=A0A2I4BZB4_AUSLI|nr:PREDICTED: wiskott-Aldrich syndrome protein homolog 1-like [Austrofundulus limnaeus]